MKSNRICSCCTHKDACLSWYECVCTNATGDEALEEMDNNHEDCSWFCMENDEKLAIDALEKELDYCGGPSGVAWMRGYRSGIAAAIRILQKKEWIQDGK